MMMKDLKRFSRYFTQYTELRVQENRNIRISMVNGDIMGNRRTAISGVSARVYKNGYWGFASNPELDDKTVKKVIESATKNAIFIGSREKSKEPNLPFRNANMENDFTTTKPKKSQKEMIEFMQKIDTHIKEKFDKLTSRTIVLSNLDMEKSLLTSDGSTSFSMIPRTICYVVMTVEKDGQPYELYEVYGGFGQFEDNFDNPEDLFPQLSEQYEHLVKKSEGVYAKAGVHDCILDANLAGILAHEAIGHTTEADIVKGGSVAADFLNKKVADELVTLVDFANHFNGELCPVPVFVDDEGTLAEDAVIIENGILKRFMTNKEYANHFNMKLSGNARAYGFDDEPLVRMRNTAILPGKSKLDDMIASIDEGYYLMKSSNGQADSTSEFMFGVVMGYEIKNGKLGKAIKDTTISGVAFDLLKTVTMISDDMKWNCGGMCGKKQLIPVGMGGPAIKCKVNIGGK
ncbi:MAG: TldD/PmbA family protein [Candidatus Cloacimonadota bacterium]|nr:MAG: TldD/PmbA family protein [Candidatus Cloacimonadota bacterium]